MKSIKLRYAVLLFSLLLLPSLFLRAQTSVQLFQQGNEAYKNGRYQEAIEAYNAILDNEQASSELYYNLGNAYFRLEEYGQSILNYERALRIKPNNRDARQNLALAQSRTEDEIAVLPEIFLVQWGHAILNWFSPTGWRIAFLIVLLLLAGAIVVLLLVGNYGWRKGSLIATIVLVVVLLLTAICSIASSARLNRHNEAIVTEPMIVVKSSPEEGSVDKLVLHEGTKVGIDETLGDWHKIHIADGNTGWVSTASVTTI